MKTLASLSLALLLFLTLSVSTSIAQDVEFENSFLMFNQNKCNDMTGVMGMVRTTIGPVLNELEEEEVITGWGVLTHSWGDEWNFNWWVATSNHAGFVTAWSELVNRMNERHPDWFERFGPMCQEHKDNLYTMHTPQ